MKIDSIIFDLDGTLWDSTGTLQKLFNNELKGKIEIQRSVTREDVKKAMGLQINEFVRCIIPYLDEESLNKVADIFLKNNCEYLEKYGAELYQGVEDTIKSLSKKYFLFIVSNCGCGYIETFLDYSKLSPYFKGSECSGNTGFSKKENIELIIKKYKLNSPVYVGDTQLDCDSAEGAELPFIFASYGFGDVKNYKYILKNISDLTKIEEM